MAVAFFLILVTLIAVPVAMTVQRPRRIFEYPFFMAFAFAAFVIPQASSLIRFPGFVQEKSVTAVMLMSCLCVICSYAGYQLAPSAFMLRWSSRPIDVQRLYQVGLVFIAVCYWALHQLNRMDVQFSENGGMTGKATILLFFSQLGYAGFAIVLFYALRRPSVATIGVVFIGMLPLVGIIVLGRREGTAMFLLTIVMAFFYERGVKPSRLALVGVLVFSMLIIPATGKYRQHAAGGDWEGVRNMDLVGNFKQFLFQESTLELRNGAAVIESTLQTGNYQLGKGYWNHLVFRFVPAQYVGTEFKQSLMFNVWDVMRNGGTEAGVQFSLGSTITGMGDSFLQFGWLGCTFFAFMAVLFKGMWKASLSKDALFARLLYALSVTSGMRAVTHWTFDFLPGLLYYVIFLGLAGVYAAVPRPRLSRLEAVTPRYSAPSPGVAPQAAIGGAAPAQGPEL